jgi:hypothetical protein
MIRYMQLVVDLSSAASAIDFRPSRLAVMVEAVQAFIREFFDQNPLSHLGIVFIRNGVAEILTELSSSPVCALLRYCFRVLSRGFPHTLLSSQKSSTTAQPPDLPSLQPQSPLPSLKLRRMLI